MSGAAAIEIVSNGPERTLEIGRAVGRLVRAGELVALSGPLGAGKTQFVKGLARGLEVPDDQPVVSPTYVLVREYAGRAPLFHCDAYRLSTLEELLDLGLDEMLAERGGVVALEWADRFAELPAAPTWRVAAEHHGQHSRRFEVTAPDMDRGKALRKRRIALG